MHQHPLEPGPLLVAALLLSGLLPLIGACGGRIAADGQPEPEAGAMADLGVEPTAVDAADANRTVDARAGDRSRLEVIDAVPFTDASELVTFHYRPHWDGVQAVSVHGPFQSAEWHQLVALSRDATGAFTATAVVRQGEYPYLFRVQGDVANPNQAGQYALDPTNPDIRMCPPESPTLRGLDPTMVRQPCAYLQVPARAAPPTFHIRGTVTQNGAPVAGWLIELHIIKDNLHHFFSDEYVPASDGKYDFVVASDRFQLRAAHPLYHKVRNDQRNPSTYQTVLTAWTGTFTVKGDVTLDPLEVGYSYADNAPAPNATAGRPVTFRFPVLPYAESAKVYVYPDWGAYIGRLLFESHSETTGSVIWAGEGVRAPRTVYWTVQQNARRGASSPTRWTPITVPVALQIAN